MRLLLGGNNWVSFDYATGTMPVVCNRATLIVLEDKLFGLPHPSLFRLQQYRVQIPLDCSWFEFDRSYESTAENDISLVLACEDGRGYRCDLERNVSLLCLSDWSSSINIDVPCMPTMSSILYVDMENVQCVSSCPLDEA